MENSFNMKGGMKTIIIVWALIVAAMCLLPPWQERIKYPIAARVFESVNPREYAPVFLPPTRTYERSISSITIDGQRLLIQVVGISVLAIGLLIVSRRFIHANAYPAQNQVLSGLCEWVEDKDGDWKAACGQGFTLFDGAPEENHYRYCPNCGKKIVAKPVDVFDEEDS